MNSKQTQLKAFERLLHIMDDLREKCPWDKKQTLQTLRHLTLEETYEKSISLYTFQIDNLTEKLNEGEFKWKLEKENSTELLKKQ